MSSFPVGQDQASRASSGRSHISSLCVRSATSRLAAHPVRVIRSSARRPNRLKFSVLEPLGMWTDIFAARIDPANVRFIACPGGGLHLL